jgi:hypothetical protein
MWYATDMGRRGFQTFSHSKHERTEGTHRFEHWYRYTLTQAVRAGVVGDYHDYPDTHVMIDLEVGVTRALKLKAFMTGIPYDRHDRGKRGGAR